MVVRCPRVRQNGKAMPLTSWQEFADDDSAQKRTVEEMMVGVSTRNYDRAVEQVPDELSPPINPRPMAV